MVPISQITPYTSLVAFCIGLPTAAGAYYQAWKGRKEAAQAREGLMYSKNCLEFVLADGRSVNLVPLETLHTLPSPGEIVLLPGSGVGELESTAMGAFVVERIEHVYAGSDGKGVDLKQARLIKVVAHVRGLTERAPSEVYTRAR